MHELSLARGILDIVRDHVPPERTGFIRKVHVHVGRLSGVVPESLEFCFSALVTESPLKQARLEIERIPLRLSCVPCGDTFEAKRDVFLCPCCGGDRTRVVSGTELRVAEIELDDDPEEVS